MWGLWGLGVCRVYRVWRLGFVGLLGFIGLGWGYGVWAEGSRYRWGRQAALAQGGGFLIPGSSARLLSTTRLPFLAWGLLFKNRIVGKRVPLL